MALDFEVDVTGPDLAGVQSLEKQLNFGTATALTSVGYEAQENCIEAIQSTFNVTRPWYLPQNRYGVHVTPATPDNLQVNLNTQAYWLLWHETETGALKTPTFGEYLAIPTKAVKPAPNASILASRRPRNLRDAFIRNTRRGPAIFQRLNGNLIKLYDLVHEVRIAPRSTIVKPTIETFEKSFPTRFAEKLLNALRTAR